MQEIIKLLFGNISADLDWLDKLKKSADLDKFVLIDAEDAAEKIYQSQPEYRNAFSRLAFFIMHEELYKDAYRLFEKDNESGKQTWWGKLRHAECLALTGDKEKAFAKVQEVYSEFPEAVNGFGHIGWTLLRKKKINEAEAVEIISRDIEKSRITNGLKAMIADIFVLSNPLLAEKLVVDAYTSNSSLRDLFSKSAIKLMKNKDYLTALEWFAKDETCARISPVKRLIYAELLVRYGKLSEAEKNVEAAYNEDKTLKNIYYELFTHSLALDTQRFSFLLEKDRERGRFSGVYDEIDAQKLSDNYALLSNITRAEKRYGRPIGEQLAVLEHMVKEQQFNIDIVDILDFRMRIAQPFDTFVQFREIFLEENYYFNSASKSPFIIDGGANTGMALAYFKWLYPESVITAFEPNPELFKICEENIKINGWKNITLHPYALSDKEGTAKFNIYPLMPMGSGLTERFTNSHASQDSYQTTVQTVRLSNFLSDYTDFIKLDIEGAENSVITEIEQKLADGCGAGFIEYHYDIKNGSNPLGEIISILENNGFYYRITGENLTDNKQIIAKKNYPKTWSMNILYTKNFIIAQ